MHPPLTLTPALAPSKPRPPNTPTDTDKHSDACKGRVHSPAPTRPRAPAPLTHVFRPKGAEGSFLDGTHREASQLDTVHAVTRATQAGHCVW